MWLTFPFKTNTFAFPLAVTMQQVNQAITRIRDALKLFLKQPTISWIQDIEEH